MKNYLSVLTLFLFFSCSSDNGKFTLNNDLLKGDVYEIPTIMNDDILEKFSSFEKSHKVSFSSGERIYIDRPDKEIQYLFISGTNENGYSTITAIPLENKLERNELYDTSSLIVARVRDSHTCTGAPCSSCDFDRATDDGMVIGGGEIIGCKCKNPSSGICNHSVSTN